MKRTIKDLELEGKKVLLRLDLNVPINNQTHEITDCTRIMESLGTINYLCEQGAKVIVCSHLGRPDGKINPDYSLELVAEKLGKLIKNKVSFAHDTVGKEAKKLTSQMENGDVVVLENLRFDKREEQNDKTFAKQLASLADIFVFDAFGTSHRKHASTYGVASYLPSAVGFLIGKELKVIGKILSNPDKPFVAVLGGAKIEDKLPVIENLLPKADYILIGGGMAYTFIKAMGGSVGNSLVDPSNIELAKSLLEKAGDKIVLPKDNICNVSIDSEEKPKKFASNKIPDNYMGLDIGPKTVRLFKKYIKKAGTVVWNGPMGVFEKEQYAHGTNKIAKYVAKTKAFTFVGGGDSAAAVVKTGYSKEINHLSTGGGASLKLLEGEKLPGIEAIQNIEDVKSSQEEGKTKTSAKSKAKKTSSTRKPATKKASATKKEETTIGKKESTKDSKKSSKKTTQKKSVAKILVEDKPVEKVLATKKNTTRKNSSKNLTGKKPAEKNITEKKIAVKKNPTTKKVNNDTQEDSASLSEKKSTKKSSTEQKVARVAQKPRKKTTMVSSRKKVENK